jgi:hypothetical protein
MPARSAAASPSRARRRSVSSIANPQSIMMHVAPASTTSALPPDPLPSDAKRAGRGGRRRPLGAQCAKRVHRDEGVVDR